MFNFFRRKKNQEEKKVRKPIIPLWSRTHIKDVVIPCLNMNHTYKRKNGIKFTHLGREVIVILELAPKMEDMLKNGLLLKNKEINMIAAGKLQMFIHLNF